MISNYWEELNMSDNIIEFHEKELSQWGIPKWMNFKCPFCGKGLPLRSIRSVSIKLNTRNIGDLAVEFCCDSCRKMDTLYFREGLSKLEEAIPYLKGDKEPLSLPVLEEKMYQMRYNNAVDKMMGGQGDKNVNNQKSNG